MVVFHILYGGTTYTANYNTSATQTLTDLATTINAGAAGSTVTAAGTGATTFTITADAGSATQMTKGTVGGISATSGTALTSTAAEQNGSSNTQMQVFTRAGKQLYGSALSSSEQTALVTSSNGFSSNAAYDSTYNNQTGSNAYMDANVTVTNPTSGDTRDYFALAGSLKEDLLVFVTGTGSAEVSGQWGSLASSEGTAATATMTISGAAIKATDTITMTVGSATLAHTFAATADLATSAAAYVAAWNASTDANVSLYTASNSAGADYHNSRHPNNRSFNCFRFCGTSWW